MPVETIKYLCEHRCGKKAMTQRSHMASHEAVCFKNPAVKACTTCVHQVYIKNGEDHSELPGCPSEAWMERGCTKLSVEDFEKLHAAQEWHSEKPVFHILPVVNCPFWERR